MSNPKLDVPRAGRGGEAHGGAAGKVKDEAFFGTRQGEPRQDSVMPERFLQRKISRV